MFDNVQHALDYGTAVSVIGASFAFIWNLQKENREKAKELHRKLRIEQTIKVVNELLTLHQKGVQIARVAQKMAAGLEVEKEISGNDMIGFCMEFEAYIRFNSEVLLIPVAREQEGKILKDIGELVITWGSNMQLALEGKSKNVPQLFDLLDDITKKLKELMESVKIND